MASSTAEASSASCPSASESTRAAQETCRNGNTDTSGASTYHVRVRGYKTGKTLPRAHGRREDRKARMGRRRSKACLRGKSPRAHKACYAVDARSWRRCPAGLPCWAVGSHAPRQSQCSLLPPSQRLAAKSALCPTITLFAKRNGREESRRREGGKGRREGREGGRDRRAGRQRRPPTNTSLPLSEIILLCTASQSTKAC